MKGARCRLSRRALQEGFGTRPGHKERLGTIKSVSKNGVCWLIRWDGNKGHDHYGTTLIEVVDAAPYKGRKVWRTLYS